MENLSDISIKIIAFYVLRFIKGIELGNDYVVIQGLVFDPKNNLWILNSGTKTTSLLKLSPDGTMTDYSKPQLMNKGFSLHVMRRPILDSRGLIWFVNSHYESPWFVLL